MAAEGKLRDDIRAIVDKRGGTARKCEWVARNNAPDWLYWVPGVRSAFWAELKAPGEEPTAGQQREHKRMRQEGHLVFVIRTVQEFEHIVAGLSA